MGLCGGGVTPGQVWVAMEGEHPSTVQVESVWLGTVLFTFVNEPRALPVRWSQALFEAHYTLYRPGWWERL
jgi:hypothetical protein